MKICLSILASLIISSCGLFDSDREEILGEYTIGWIDTNCTRTIWFGPLGQMEGEVFELGFDKEFILAKRHPNCDKDETDYFVIDISKNAIRGKLENTGKPCLYDCKFGVFGPYTHEKYMAARVTLGVPSSLEFTHKY